MKVKVTARVKAVTPDPSHQHKLLQFLRAYRDSVQYIIDQIWKLKHIPSMKELHHRFYRILRRQGFRAHHCHKIERRAREVVKATKKNHGSKPILRKLTARLDYQDYKLDIINKTVRVAILNSEWVELKLLWYEYLDKYFNGEWKLKEILVSYCENEVWIYFTFEKEIVLKRPRAVMGVDINFSNIAYTIVNTDGKVITMGTIPFNGLRRALTHKIIAEKIQRRYSKKWRYVRRLREAIKRHGRRARNILVDSCYYISRRIVEVAREYNALIVLENLNRLRDRAIGSRGFNKKLTLWAYRRIQSYIHYKALVEGLQVVYVDPRGTSKTSPIGGKLVFINRRWVKLPNGYIVTRDIIASWNLALRGLNSLTQDVGLRGFMEAPKAPDQMQPQEGMKGKPVPELILTTQSSRTNPTNGYGQPLCSEVITRPKVAVTKR